MTNQIMEKDPLKCKIYSILNLELIIINIEIPIILLGITLLKLTITGGIYLGMCKNSYLSTLNQLQYGILLQQLQLNKIQEILKIFSMKIEEFYQVNTFSYLLKEWNIEEKLLIY